MQLIEARDIIRTHRNRHTSFKEIADALCITEQAVRKRVKNNTLLRDDEKYMLADRFNLPLRLFFSVDKVPTSVRIGYYKHPTLKLYELPDMPFYTMDMNIAYSYSRSFNPANFRIITMIGNGLDGGEMWVRDKNPVLIDLKATDIRKGGLYCYIASEDYINFAYIKEEIDGVHFKFHNPEKEVVESKEYLESINFEVVGRIIKNLFYFN